jgi:hypothetical protein
MRYSLRTLLIVITWAGLVFLGLHSPTALMAGIISTITLATVLLAVLMATYRAGASRAMAIGYLVFCVGYLVHLVIANWLNSGAMAPWTVAFMELFIRVHAGGPGVFNFTTIGHSALSCILGFAGAISAQVLYRNHRNGSNFPPS